MNRIFFKHILGQLLKLIRTYFLNTQKKFYLIKHLCGIYFHFRFRIKFTDKHYCNKIVFCCLK
jgi:hypothetical protein